MSNESIYVESLELAEMPFPEAAKAWLLAREVFISPKTFHEYELNINTLGRFFCEMRLREITPELIRAYQRTRARTVSAFAVNHECSVIQQMLKHVGLWDEIRSQYQPLPLPKKKRGRAITAETRKKLFRLMSLNKDWDAARLAAMICINSTASPGEAYKLRLRDVDMPGKRVILGMNGAKNEGRVRPIPMNDELYDACREAAARAKILGSYKPEHYLFPRRAFGRQYDPELHQVTFRTGWMKIIKKAVESGLEVSGLRLEDMRHCAITGLLEDPSVSDETVEALAGHVDGTMKRFYSHIREEAARNAVSRLDNSFVRRVPGSDELSETLNNQAVLDMLECGIPSNIVIAKIRTSRRLFDTSIAAIKELRNLKVPDTVIVEMVSGKSNLTR
jgi:integrase